MATILPATGEAPIRVAQADENTGAGNALDQSLPRIATIFVVDAEEAVQAHVVLGHGLRVAAT